MSAKTKNTKTKKYISALLAVVVLILAAYITSYALKGDWAGVKWKVDQGVLTVSGKDIPSSTASKAAPWMKFSDNITKVVIGKDVKYIGDRAFEDLEKLTSVDLGIVTELGEMVFSGCTSLQELTIPNTVKVIGNHAFAECSSLKRMTMSSSIESIGENAWEACFALERINGGSAKYYTVDGVLIYKDSASLVKYPAGRTSEVYTVPEEVTTIASGAFRDCSGIKTVIMNNVKSVGDGAFSGCTSLENVQFPSVKTIGRAAFNGCVSLKEIKFPASLEKIGDDAFGQCSMLGIANFEGNTPAANEGIFFGCDAAFIVLADPASTGFGESWLGYPVIYNNTYSGTVGNEIEWVLDSATGVMTVTGNGPIPDFEDASDTPWYEYRKLIRKIEFVGITSIGTNSFRYCAVRELDVPAAVKVVGDWAFSGCTYLDTVTVKGAARIGECAFFGDIGLKRVYLRSVSAIGKQAFSGCESLEWVFAAATAPELGEYAFDGSEVAVLYPMGGTGYTSGEWANVYSEEYVAGDANGDGKCNISDVSHMLKYIAKWDLSIKRISADVNLDSKINLSDVSSILMYIAKWDIEIGIR